MLIFTQKVNMKDPVLGFFHEWLIEFSKYQKKILVVCLEKGEYSLPENIEVISLGKEKGYGKIKILKNLVTLIFTRKYSNVFVHMNPEYLVLFGWYWRMTRKKVCLWYTHKAVNLKLKIATFFANTVLTASKESFRYPTKKLKIMGHGIDSSMFYPPLEQAKIFKIISVGRISSTKNYLPLIEAIQILKHEAREMYLEIVGSPVTDKDQKYFDLLKEYVERNLLTDYISFTGGVDFRDLPSVYRSARIFVNLSNTGSMDKAVLEAMATGVPVITSNEAFKDNPFVFFIEGDLSHALVKKIKDLENSTLQKNSVDFVVKEHSLPVLIGRIMKMYEI